MEYTTSIKYDIKITRTLVSKIDTVDFDNIPFGRIFSDHIFMADYADGKWKDLRIQPIADLSLHPATAALHYGQSVFEGMKAYYGEDGEAKLFRPEMNIKRMNRSAYRMAMPDIPEDMFMEALIMLVDQDRDWIPKKAGGALYIRPLLFAMDNFIGVKPAEKFKFLIMTCPVDVYYPKPVKVLVAKKYCRAFKGGTGAAKAAGNYGATMLPQRLAREQGFDQVLWLDGVDFRYVHEIGTMNVFFVVDDKVYTPPANEGVILKGITRDSVITLLKNKGYEVVKKPLDINKIIDAAKEGRLQEAFGSGTAASIAYIAQIGHEGQVYDLPAVANFKVANWLKKELDDIKSGATADPYGWMTTV